MAAFAPLHIGVAAVVIFPWIAGRSDPAGSETTQGALSSDGKNRYVEIRDSDAYSLDKTSELTIGTPIPVAEDVTEDQLVKRGCSRAVSAGADRAGKGRQGAYEWELRFIGDRLNFYMSNSQGSPTMF